MYIIFPLRQTFMPADSAMFKKERKTCNTYFMTLYYKAQAELYNRLFEAGSAVPYWCVN